MTGLMVGAETGNDGTDGAGRDWQMTGLMVLTEAYI